MFKFWHNLFGFAFDPERKDDDIWDTDGKKVSMLCKEQLPVGIKVYAVNYTTSEIMERRIRSARQHRYDKTVRYTLHDIDVDRPTDNEYLFLKNNTLVLTFCDTRDNEGKERERNNTFYLNKEDAVAAAAKALEDKLKILRR